MDRSEEEREATLLRSFLPPSVEMDGLPIHGLLLSLSYPFTPLCIFSVGGVRGSISFPPFPLASPPPPSAEPFSCSGPPPLPLALSAADSFRSTEGGETQFRAPFVCCFGPYVLPLLSLADAALCLQERIWRTLSLRKESAKAPLHVFSL